MEVICKKQLCIVHIGMPKTGSTTLQNTFFKGISDPRVCYGSLPHPNQSGWLYSLFATNTQGYHFLEGFEINTPEKLEAFRVKTKSSLIEGFLNKKSSIEILSGEDLFHLDKDGIGRLKSFLDTYFEKTIIVAYVRPLKSFMESAFQQRVKYHGDSSFDFKRIYHPFKNLKRYDEVFGVDNVKLLKFQPYNFPDGDIVLDFCENLHIEPMRAIQKIANESISKEAISILFAYNFHKEVKTDFGRLQVKVNYELVDALRSIGCERFRFSSAVVNEVINNFREDYDWMLNRLEGFDVSPERCDGGFNSELELMEYSTNFIGNLLGLVDSRDVDFEYVRHPQTVAKLVDLLALKLHRGLVV
ncbi:hypothetical protein [Aquipseudomonas alcaligenes]|uniref:hypothetical protein n=1 Tax=Aquipseudomonas alcaligenes TaxID=43263 RepID=UPI00365D8804